MSKQLGPYPNPESDDRAHTVVKGLLGAIPIAGNLAAEGFNEFFAPEITRRRNRWFTHLGDAVREIQSHLSAQDFDKLRSDPSFYTAVRHATEIAGRTHQEEKLILLRNAIINSALPQAPSDDMRHVYLNLVDDLTPMHMLLLKRFRDYPPARFGDAPLDSVDIFRDADSDNINWVFDLLPELKSSGSPAAQVELLGSLVLQLREMRLVGRPYIVEDESLGRSRISFLTGLALGFGAFIVCPQAEKL